MDLGVQRDTSNLVAVWVRKDNAQERPGGRSVVTAGRKAPEPSHALRQRHRRRVNVEHLECRQVISADVPHSEESRGYKTTIEYSARFQRVPTEDLTWVLAVVAPIADDHQHFGAEQPDENDPGAEVEHAIAVKSLAPAKAVRGDNGCEKRQRQQQTVGGKLESAEFKKDRMQQLPRNSSGGLRQMKSV